MSLPFVGRMADGAIVCAFDADRQRYIVNSPTANYESGVCVCVCVCVPLPLSLEFRVTNI